MPFRVHEDASSRAYCPSLTDGSGLTDLCGSSLLGRGADHHFSFLHVTFQLLATSRMCTIFRSLSCFQSAPNLSQMSFMGCLGGLPPWCLGYPLRKSTIQSLGRTMGSRQPILRWVIHAGPCSDHNINPSIVPTAEVTLQSWGATFLEVVLYFDDGLHCWNVECDQDWRSPRVSSRDSK